MPRRLTIVSPVRTFSRQATIVRGQLSSRRISSTSSAADIETALRDILRTRSMPGFSRHHWGTDIDLLSADRSRWEGPPGADNFVDVIPFLNTEARNFGFFHPYTAGLSSPATAGFPRPADPHYLAEPWHLSYWPLANVLEQQWAAEFRGATLSALIDETARAIAGPLGIPQVRMASVLSSLGLEHYQTNVAPSP